MPAVQLTREEAIQEVESNQLMLSQIADMPGVQLALGILKQLGSKVGYKPAFRALVMGMKPADAVQWKDK